MATIDLTIETGVTKVEGSIPSLFRLVNSIPEIRSNQVYFKGGQVKGLLTEEEGRYRRLKVGETPEHETIYRLSDSVEHWELEYEALQVTGYDNHEDCIVRNVFYKGQLLYKIGSASDCKAILKLQF